MDKLVIEVNPPRVSQSNLVRLTDESMQLIRGLQSKSGLSATCLVGRMIEFAAERVVLVGGDEQEV